MDKIRTAVRKVLTTNLGDSDIATACDVSRNTVKRYRAIAAEKGYEWNQLADLADDKLDACFNSVLRRGVRKRMPDFAHVHAELQKKSVTMVILWEEYVAANPEDALSYSQFTEHHRRYTGSLNLSMRQTHEPGQKVFIDFSGLRPKYKDPTTGVEVYVELFVGVLGYSKLTFATCVATQKVDDWIHANNQMFAFFRGVPVMVVPDNLKSAVITAGREPTLNRNYADLCEHYGAAIMPARVYRPKDKPHAEAGVLLAQRWILARLRNRQFFSLAEINAAVAPLLEKLNNAPFKRQPGTRRSRFEDGESSTLMPLPDKPYVYAEWSGSLRVDKSYHILVKDHWYSVPHGLVGKKVSARVCSGRVEILYQHMCVASHSRSDKAGEHTTDLLHQPANHRAYAERSPENYLAWAKTIGPNLLKVVQRLLDVRVPALGFPACETLRNLGTKHDADEVEAAATRAVEIQSLTAKTVRSLLSAGKHRKARAERIHSAAPINHANIRGGSYYH